MLITGLPYSAFQDIVRRVSARTYDGNIIIADYGEYSGARFHAAIRVSSSSGKGARRSASGRRMAVACWHAHRDVLIELFRLYPDARVKSGRLFVADYKGADGFRASYPETGQADVGWTFFPVRITELCECGGNVPRTAAETRALYEPAFAQWWAEQQAVEAELRARQAERAAATDLFRASRAWAPVDEPEPYRGDTDTTPASSATCEPVARTADHIDPYVFGY